MLVPAHPTKSNALALGRRQLYKVSDFRGMGTFSLVRGAVQQRPTQYRYGTAVTGGVGSIAPAQLLSAAAQ